MKIEIDTHTHTLVSGHAYNTMNEMADAAAKKGLKGLAITDHSPGMPGSTNVFHFQNLRVVPRERAGIELLLGAELNVMNEKGEVDLPASVLREIDLTVASIHKPCYKGEIDVETITGAYMHVMENPYIDIIGHPDDGRYPADYEALAKKARETGTFLEVNNSSLSPMTFRENAEENVLKMLSFCKKYGAGIVLGTDAHVDTAIADYGYAERLIREADFPEELIMNTSLEKLKSSLKRAKKG